MAYLELEVFSQGKRRYSFKDVLLGKVRVPRTDEDYDMEPEEGKKLTAAADMNDLAYSELILLIDDKISSRKVAFKLVKRVQEQRLCRWKRKYGLEEIKKQV
jgi:hypothetical protein